MAVCQTIRVKIIGAGDGIVIINGDDYDPEVHTRVVDRPTMEEPATSEPGEEGEESDEEDDE